jgi:hypothetical protein
MFLSKLFASAPTEIEKMLLEQQETLRKLDIIKNEVQKIKDNPTPEIIKNMYDAPNTLQNPIFDASKIPGLERVDRFFDFTDKIGNYLNHPILIVNAVAGASYWVCLIVAMGGVLYYMIGHKKGLKYTSGSILTYTLAQAVNWGLNSL